MECALCKGKMERATAPFAVYRHGYHIHWDAVPAWVCAQCGEPHFEAQEVDVVQRAIQAIERESAGLKAS